MKKHENYRELIWALAKTDFKLRYQNSVLGYVWAVLNPLLTFLVLNFIFTHIFARGAGIRHYSLQLFTAIVLFNFFSEGTRSGMASLITKSSLVKKIYVPRWTIIISSTINSVMIFLMNLIVVVAFFAFNGVMPSSKSIALFIFFAFLTYLVILGFSFLTATLYVKFRDLLMIWGVLLTIMFYATPIIYPVQILPKYIQQVVLLSPIAFIVHFSKEALINNHFPYLWQILLFASAVFIFLGLGYALFKKTDTSVAENI